MAEKKYIELQKALSVCEMHYEHCLEMHDWSGDATADNIKRDIETLPTADVVEVVRCIECIHRDKKGVCEKFRQRYPFFPEDDFYCGFGAKMDGERKEPKIIYENEKYAMVEVV